MKKEIKSGLIIGITFLLTVMAGGLVYAGIVGSVTTGQTLTADMWNNMANNYNYSTDEVNTGKKWINGKPIYRKVYTFEVDVPGNSTNTPYEFPFNNSADNIETLVDSNVIMGNTNQDGLSYHVSYTNHSRYQVTTSAFKLFRSGAYNGEIHITIEYTKSID